MRHWELLIESDERIRRLERRWKETGTEEDKDRYVRELRRSGRDDDADHIVIKPHLDNYVRSYRKSRAPHLPNAERQAAHKEMIDHKRTFINKSAKLRRNPGDFIKGPIVDNALNSRQRRNDHIRDLARLHSSEATGDGRAIFRYTSFARALTKSIKHHYPEAHVSHEVEETGGRWPMNTVTWSHKGDWWHHED